MGASSSSYQNPLGSEFAPDLDFFLYRRHIGAGETTEALRVLRLMKDKYRNLEPVMEFLNSDQLRSMSMQEVLSFRKGRYSFMYGA